MGGLWGGSLHWPDLSEGFVRMRFRRDWGRWGGLEGVLVGIAVGRGRVDSAG